MEKLKMQSMNTIDDNVKKLGELFPECLTEVKKDDGKLEKAIDFDKLKSLFSSVAIEGNKERYQFTWPDKAKARALVNQTIEATLRPCKDESVNFDTTENLYIEGDNLDVLKLLRETYYGKVKIIYIDPPYNTGSDFVYKDDFSLDAKTYKKNSGQYDYQGNRLYKNQESNGRFHTDWLNMMYPRLKIARDFLAKDGVIFISIDDNEQENLKKICDEIFGSANFVSQLVWEKKKKGSFLSNSITNIKEYVLVYAKSIDFFPGLIGEINCNDETYPCINAGNNREIRTIPAGIKSNYRERNYVLCKGSVISDTTMDIVLHSDLVIENGRLARDLILEGNWRYSQEAMCQYALNNEIYITRDLYLRRIVKNPRTKTLKDILPRVGFSQNSSSDDIDFNNLSNSGWGSNEDADEELRLLFGVQKILDYPKPVRLLEKLIASYRNIDDMIVVDFFSGSATTAHAVMHLNAEDGGKRKFIMVQLPEACAEDSEAYKAGYKNICEIGKERIRRAGKKILEEQQGKNGDLFSEKHADLDVGFRVLKLDSSNMNDVYYHPEDLRQDELAGLVSNIKEGRTDEDLLFQVMLDLGVVLSSNIEVEVIGGKKVFNVSKGYLIACFDENVDEDLIKAVAEKTPTFFVMRDSSLANDSVSVNFDQIFAKYSPETTRKVL